MDKFIVSIHHGGILIKENGLKYSGGGKYELDAELDIWSLQEITAVLKELGYKGTVKIFYLFPKGHIDEGLLELRNDNDCMEMGNRALTLDKKTMVVYIMHDCAAGDGVQLTCEVNDLVTEVFHEGVIGGNEKKCDQEDRVYEGSDDSLMDINMTDLEDDHSDERRTSPGSTMKIQVERRTVDNQRIFKRMYMCLEPVKRGFLAACRPIIGVDGCFLKGPYGGILLVAVGMDPNDQYFPLAVAIVESETKDSWSWFLNMLMNDIGHIRERRWIFISDQQKGLLPAFDEILHGTEHRFCVTHLYSNIKKKYGGGTVLRDVIMAAAKATYPQQWEFWMTKLEVICKEAHDTLRGKHPSAWTRSHFSAWPKCDAITNNISEAFNGTILKARELPIISMFDWIRHYLMSRFANSRLKADKYIAKGGKICPKPRDRLDKEIEKSRKWYAKWAGQLKFEVSCFEDSYIVDLEERSCSCRFWDLTGLPCQHAVSCIFHQKLDPHDFVCLCYRIEKYAACYAPIVEPINGQDMWPVTDNETLLPPKLHKRPGRPKKLRRRERDETPKPHNLRRTNSSLRCATCKTYGHNKRTCPQMVQVSGGSEGLATPTQQNDIGQAAAQSQNSNIILSGRGRGRGKGKWRGRGANNVSNTQ